MKTHVTDDPTEADVKALLEQMTTVFTGLDGGGVGLRVMWADAVPIEVRTEMRKRNASFAVQIGADFIIGYKGSDFKEPGPVFVPIKDRPADRGERYIFPGPQLKFSDLYGTVKISS